MDAATWRPSMTKHKATAQQWQQVKRFATTGVFPTDSCTYELLSRIEVLEATQHAHVNTLRLSDKERDQIRQDLARLARVYTTAEVAPIVVPSSPADLLIDRVTWLIAKQFSESRRGTDCTPFGRAVILEVAAWLRAESEGHLGSGLHWARRLQQEANR